jgi:hypothetical protein
MKKTEIIRAIVELVSVGILKSADGYRLIEQVIETTKFGTNKKDVESPTEIEENKELAEKLIP